MAHLVKRLTLDFGSGHDLTVHEFKPQAQSLLGILSLSPSLSAPPSLVCTKVQDFPSGTLNCNLTYQTSMFSDFIFFRGLTWYSG